MPRSITGAELDPEDGFPIFKDGMSRKRWLEHSRPARKQALVDELLATTEDDIEDDIEDDDLSI